VNEDVLLTELDDCQIPRNCVVVDLRAVLITRADLDAEQEIAESIGSTGSGTGASLIRRMARRGDPLLVAQSEAIRARACVEPVAPLHTYCSSISPSVKV